MVLDGGYAVATQCVANRHIHILVRTRDFQMRVPLPLLFVFKRRLMRDDEFLARHSEFDADVKWLAAPMMPMRRLDDHAAARDAVEILVELIRFLLDPRMRPYFGRSSALAGS